MDPGVITDLFALLLLGGVAGLAVALLVPTLRRRVAKSSLILASLVAVGATAGSLYLSEVAGYVPCEMCWFQRIAMYPLAVILAIATATKDKTIFRYVAVLSGGGLAIALYHVQLQMFPDQGSFCELTNPCTSSPTKALGWMTIPQMSALSFSLIFALSLLSIFKSTSQKTV